MTMTKSHEEIERIAFLLEQIEEWPPVSVEHLWLKGGGATRTLESIPFFVKGISLGDEIDIERNDVGEVVKYTVSKKSDNTTIWFFSPQISDFERVANVLEQDAILFEGLEEFSMLAISLPPEKPLAQWDTIFSTQARSEDATNAFPSLRHVG